MTQQSKKIEIEVFLSGGQTIKFWESYPRDTDIQDTYPKFTTWFKTADLDSTHILGNEENIVVFVRMHVTGFRRHELNR